MGSKESKAVAPSPQLASKNEQENTITTPSSTPRGSDSSHTAPAVMSTDTFVSAKEDNYATSAGGNENHANPGTLTDIGTPSPPPPVPPLQPSPPVPVPVVQPDAALESQMLFSADSGGRMQQYKPDDFILMNVIGRGSFGKVMQVMKKDTNKVYAMKVMRKSVLVEKDQVNHTKAERNILEKARHPFLVGLQYAFQTKEKLYLVMDYVNGGELFYHLRHEGAFDENRCRFYTAELVLALEHLHSLGIIYRDLKSENILLDESGHIKLTDFGLSKELPVDGEIQVCKTFCGTPEYLAPEVLKGVGYSFSCDFWSLGVMMFEMLMAKPPFYSTNQNELYHKILNDPLVLPRSCSNQAKSLLKGLLEKNPKKRLTMSEIKKHPFFSGIDWKKLERKEYEPLFVPNVMNERDISQFDPTFTREVPFDSVRSNDGCLTSADDVMFRNFAYTRENV